MPKKCGDELARKLIPYVQEECRKSDYPIPDESLLLPFISSSIRYHVHEEIDYDFKIVAMYIVTDIDWYTYEEKGILSR